MELRNEKDTEMPMADENGQNKHNMSVRFSLFKRDEEEDRIKIIDWDYGYSYGMAPGEASEKAGGKSRRPSTNHGVGSGSTTVVVNSGGGAAPPAGDNVWGNVQSADGGVDGVVSNVFAKEDVVKVDVDPNLRRDLLLETYSCCGCFSGGCAWFFKIPDCLGAGCNMTSLCNSGKCTCKLLQKPTFCEVVQHCSLLDMSTCCSNRGENDNTCCTAYACSYQATWCCLLQNACKQECGLMRTCLQFWGWILCCDTRCACPPGSFAPLQCLFCGFGYRAAGIDGTGGGLGCRIKADTTADAPPAAAGGNTTVVVVNS